MGLRTLRDRIRQRPGWNRPQSADRSRPGPPDEQPGAGDDVRTAATYLSDEETDIPEDFKIANRDGTDRSVSVTVPSGATHLFVSPLNNSFENNADSDGNYRLRITSEKRQRESLSQTLSTLDDQAYLLTETDARIPRDREPQNERGELSLLGNLNGSNTELVDQQKVEVPPTGSVEVRSEYTSPSNTGDPPITLTVFYGRVYSLAEPDTPPDWDLLDYTTTRFVGRSEFTWD